MENSNSKPWRLTKWHADHLRWITPVFMSSIGYLYPNPKLWFESLFLMLYNKFIGYFDSMGICFVLFDNPGGLENLST